MDGFEEVLLKEADSCLNQLIEATKKDGDVNPLSYVRCSSVNVILTAGFGVDGCPSPEDPLFKKLEYIINTVSTFLVQLVISVPIYPFCHSWM